MPPVDAGTADQQPAADDTIRSALAAAIAEHDEPDETKPAAIEPSADTADASGDAPATRARGTDGKFVKAEDGPAEVIADDTKPKLEAKPETQIQDEARPAEQPKGLELPANWSQADRQAFKALPPEGQKVLKSMIDRQEADYTKKTQSIAALKTEYEPVDQLFSPYREQMKARGFTPRTLIEAWSNVEKRLMEGDGVNVLAGLVRGYNIDLNRVAHTLGFRPSQQQQAEPDPNAAPDQPQGHPTAPLQRDPELMAEILELRQRQDLIDRDRADGIRRGLLEREQKAESDIQTFRSAADEKGGLLHPHFDEVEDAMTVLAQGYSARKQPIPPLNELYETAVWANRTTRDKLRTADQQAAEDKRNTAARAKAAAARTAASSVTGAPGAGQSALNKTAERSLREDLEAAAGEAA